MRKLIDLRSDTVTTPTPEMRQAMAEAEVGDDVYGEDPTVNRLQDRSAEILGREAALFVPSGTMGNQIAVKLHTRPGQEVILEERTHLFNYEMATMAALSGCLARPVKSQQGHPSWGEIEAALSPDVYYRASTGLIVLENTHNMAGGTVMSAEQTQETANRAHDRGIPVHLDGARIFNAAVALKRPAQDLCCSCDSVMFCLSKGLSAPVGSLLLGSRPWITEARRVRKMMGGGMRQAGIVAAAGLVALETMPHRLQEDHSNARLLAQSLARLEGLDLDLETVQTNIVLVNLRAMTSLAFVKGLCKEGVLAGSTGPHQVRFVTHREVGRQDIRDVVAAIGRVLERRASKKSGKTTN